MEKETNLTQLFVRLRQGEKAVWDDIFTAAYQELHRLAQRQLFRAWGVDTLSTTVLVHEVYCKLNKANLTVADRRHFYAIAAKAMRQIVINYAEQKQSQKRGGDWLQVSFSHAVAQSEGSNHLLAVEAALGVLAKFDTKLCSLVEMRFFAGMNEREIAAVMGVSERSVRRQWRKAKALLAVALREGDYDSNTSLA